MAELKSAETIAMQASSLMEKYVLQDMEEEVESEIARDVILLPSNSRSPPHPFL